MALQTHLATWRALIMMLQAVSDAFLCFAFPTTLKTCAWAWYSSLQLGTIHSFKQFKK